MSGLESPETGRWTITNQELCVQIDRPGPSRSSVVIRQRPLQIARGHHYQLRLRAHATATTRVRARLSKISAPYTELWAATAEVGSEARGFAASFTTQAGQRRQRRAGHQAPAGPLAGAVPLTVWASMTSSSNDPAGAEIPIERLHPRRSPRCASIRSATCRALPKIATVVATGEPPRSTGSWSMPRKGAGHRQGRAPSGTIARRARGSTVDFFLGDGDWPRLHLAASGTTKVSPFAIGPERLPAAQVRRPELLLPAAERHPIEMPYAGSRSSSNAPRTSGR